MAKVERETVGPKKVLVCMAKLVWTPNRFPNEDYVCVTDTRRDRSCLTRIDIASFEKIAESLFQAGRDFQIIYEPETRVETSWADGYFGRPRIPAAVYQLSRLSQEQIAELEASLAKLMKLR